MEPCGPIMLEHSGNLPRDFTFVNGVDTFPQHLRNGVVAIGNFDGVHRGHQAVLGEALAQAGAAGGAVTAMTFEPHPRVVFRPDVPLFRLTSPAAKARLVQALGLNGLAVVPFDRDLAAVTADDFVARVLIDRLGITAVVVGYDFHFGRGRGGSPAFLASAGQRLGFDVAVVEAFADEGGAIISSSRIRDALSEGDLGQANGLLGYRWFVIGEIVGGEKRGRELGYPTANMRLGDDCALKHGVYAVYFTVDGVAHHAVASYGRRPQFDNGAPLLETFLFDFSGDLYGKTATVTFVGYLRPELKFDSVATLIERMDQDSAEARAILAAAGPGNALDRALDRLS